MIKKKSTFHVFGQKNGFHRKIMSNCLTFYSFSEEQNAQRPFLTKKIDLFLNSTSIKNLKKGLPTAPSVPKRSPIQVLTGLDAA